jgi:DNA polymerase-3 subunit epsilon
MSGLIRNRSFWMFVALTLLGLAGVCASVGIIVWNRMSASESDLLRAVLLRHTGEFLALGIVVLVGVTISVDWIFRLYILPVDRLAEEAAVVFESNPDRLVRMHASREVMRLASVVNRAAERFGDLQRSLDARIREASSRAQSATDILSVVVAELHEGVVICNPDGLITLYNERARRLLEPGEAPRDEPGAAPAGALVGLGRSLIGVLDKDLLAHVFDSLIDGLLHGRADSRSTALVTSRGGSFLRLEAAAILGEQREVTGFVLVFADVTRQLDAHRQADAVMQQLLTTARASIRGIRDALGMAADGRAAVREATDVPAVVHRAVDRLSDAVERAAADYPRTVHAALPLARVRLSDLLRGVERRAANALGLQIRTDRVPSSLWVRVDGYSFSLAILVVLSRLRGYNRQREFVLAATQRETVIRLDILWSGDELDKALLRELEGQGVAVAEESLPATVGDVFTRFGIEAEPLASSDPDGLGLRLTMASAEAAPPPAPRSTLLPVNRPVFYDFDLFRQRGTELDHRKLTDLAFTVFDTETTGLDPGGGDEIIAIGAVRIVNGRLLREETFEQLVNPRRPIPQASIRVHGIQPGVLALQPGIERVLPLFHRYAGGTVLVGHNAAFDMRMLQEKEAATGIRFEQPVLDTMLLSAVLHPTQDNHGLEAIADRLGITIIGRHTALGDAVATAEIFLRLIPLLAARGFATLEEARNASRRTHEARLRY